MSVEPNPAGKLFPQIIKVGSAPKWDPIGLTSPQTEGHEVAEAQFLLGHNRWGLDFKPGKIDGVYGPRSAHATMQAKYWTGYKLDSSEYGPIFGSKLRSYLLPRNHVNARPLGPMDAIRRRHRLEQHRLEARDKIVIGAFNIALSQVGYDGSGNAGICSKYGEWYGLPCTNWCAEFVSYCIDHAGGTLKESFVPNIVMMAELHQGKLSIAADPYRGCLVCYDWQGDGVWDHIEFFDEWVDHEHLSFMAVGGNTGEVNGQIGGQVLHQPRSSAIRHVFVNYTIRHPA